MIEEIQALMPILEKISDGALWAFGIFMAVKIVNIVVWPVVLAFIALKAIPVISGLFVKVDDRKVDLYEMRYRGASLGARYIGDLGELTGLMNAMCRESGFVHGSDVLAATKLIREAGQ